MGRQQGKRYTYEEVKIIIKNIGFKLISNKYLNNSEKLVIRDKDGYMYFVNLRNLLIYWFPRRFHKSNPYTIRNIKLWCKLNNKPFRLIDGQIYKGSNKKLIWKCLKENCQEYFNSNWNDISSGHGCGVCFGLQVTLSNCLATKNPELAKEWHPTMNGNLTPWDITSCSNKEVWWQCKDNPKHEWSAEVNNRNTNNTSCPYCSGKLPSEDYNLLTCKPELCKEWDYNKNDNKPEEYTPYTSNKVWWICKECNCEWEATISHRSNGRGCPDCNKSKGEKECKRIFDLGSIYYISQKEFEGLLGLGGGNLSYDFYLPKYNLLIEYQGEMHESFVKGIHKSIKDFEKQVEHDRRKKEYALLNGYSFLEIWYWDFNNIEEIIYNYFNIKEVKQFATLS